MTNEEAIEVLAQDLPCETDEDLCEAMTMAIKALEQQPCEDAVSRQAVEEMIKAEMPERGMWEIEGDIVKDTVCEVCVDLMQELSKLPSVTPKEKTRWIPVSERLPETNVEVLVTTEWDFITIGEMLSSNDWFIHEGATNVDMDDIKAWMPLPELYEPESEE